MQRTRIGRTKVLAVGFGLALLMAVALPAGAQASPPPTSPPFTECPAVGHDTSCGTLIVINQNGSASLATDGTQPAFNSGTGDLVGIVNNSNALVQSVSLSGSSIFTLTSGQGLCAVEPTPCFSDTEFGPTGYEGPGTSFSVSDSNDGSVNFAGAGLSPGTDTYFSLGASPSSVSSVGLASDIGLTVSSISATAGVNTPENIASFTDGGSTASPSDFAATIDWGDGSPNTTGVVPTQTGGPGTPYEVSADHIYTGTGTFDTSVTITDTSPPGGDPTNTATGTGTANVTGDTITASPGTIADQTVNSPFTATVATFTDSNPAAPLGEFSASINWGDSPTPTTGMISQEPDGTFDVEGGHTYTTTGSFTVTVTITDTSGSPPAVVSEMVSVANEVITCSSGCSGSTTGDGETTGVSSSSGSGTVLVTINPDNGALDCGDSYRHSPNTVTISEAGLANGLKIDVHMTFLSADLVGPAGDPIGVCFQADNGDLFKDLEGNEVNTGLLPSCRVPGVGHRSIPCLQPIKHGGSAKYTYERVVIPSNDPKWS